MESIKADRFGNGEEEGIRAGFCEGLSYDETLALIDINFSIGMSRAALKVYEAMRCLKKKWKDM